MGNHRDPVKLIRQLSDDMFTAMPDTDSLGTEDYDRIHRIIKLSNSRSLIVRWSYSPVCLRWRAHIQALYSPRHSKRKR
jgi:hypothetical protein